ncbi:hypothetical protein [Legionella genomosp. 1]|uniref:hypothetical protein n=1 Tax=Legionella genomosp. 1 TaxID=1093625 RepID=UPI001056DDD0|nr:hypothetical protein [Legionella genomosp. 1]
MKRILVLTFALLSGITHAQEFKIFWRCADTHLEAIESQANLNGKLSDLYINYASPGNNSFNFSPVSKKSLVELPKEVVHGNYLMLGIKGEWLMNCVGQVVVSPNYHYPKVVFDAGKNAYGCPLIPKNCAGEGSVVLLDY